MLEKAVSGNSRYWLWLGFLAVMIGIGFFFYLVQFHEGLGVTGMNRNITWGLYIGQFTFLVGIAASAVMLVIPYYLHNYKKFKSLIIMGEFLAVSAVIMCMVFIMADMGQPMRFLNIPLNPTPWSIMFWDMIVLSGYLVINAVVGYTSLESERKGFPPPKWVKYLVYLSIPWAISIHTVTAFLYAGLPGRHFWLSAIMAARFLASAFAGGPAFLIILALIVRKVSRFDPGLDAIKSIGKIVAYAMIANLFFLGLEAFTALYSGIPGHDHAFKYLYVFGYQSQYLPPLMWGSLILGLASLIFLIPQKIRENTTMLAIASVLVFISLWIDKGFGLIIGGFNPNPLGYYTDYWPTLPETMITIGVWGMGLFVLTLLYKVVIGVREQALK